MKVPFYRKGVIWKKDVFQVSSAFGTNPCFVVVAIIHIVYSDSAVGIF